MTPEEISILNAERERLDMLWAGPALIHAELQKDGLAEEWIVADEKRNIPRPELEAMFSDASVASLIAALNSNPVLDYRWKSIDNPDMSHANMRERIQGMSAAGVITADECTAALRLGERRKTRSEELLDRQLTVAEITEAFNAE